MKDQPNFIIFLSDQQRWDTMTYAGVMEGITPNLDRLGAEGTLFENCFSTQPLCGPARACLQTSRYASETGNNINGHALPHGINSIATLFNDNGYDTAYIGKWHLSKDYYSFEMRDSFDVPPEDRGGYSYWMASNLLEYTSHAFSGHVFDNNNHPIEFNSYRPDAITDMAIDYLEHRASDKPVFLMISQLEPHHQNDMNNFYGPEGSIERFSDRLLPPDLEALGGNATASFPDYLGACYALDENVGRLERFLKSRGEWENTIFVYTSDHGCHFQTRNSEYKRSCHDSSIHVPLVIHGGCFNGRGNVKTLVSLLDVPSTILASAGIEIPMNYRGLDLRKVIDGTEAGRTSVFAQITEAEAARTVRTTKWKYCIKSPNVLDACMVASPQQYDEEYLYDLETDPYELNNLIGKNQYEKEKEELRNLIISYISEVEHITPSIRLFSDIPPIGTYHPEMSMNSLIEDPKSAKLLEKYFSITDKKQLGLGGFMSAGIVIGLRTARGDFDYDTANAFFEELNTLR